MKIYYLKVSKIVSLIKSIDKKSIWVYKNIVKILININYVKLKPNFLLQRIPKKYVAHSFRW